MWAKVQHAYTRNTQAETHKQTNTVHPPTPRPPVGAVMTNWCTNMLLQDQVHQAGGYDSIPCAATDIFKGHITLGQLCARIRNIHHKKMGQTCKGDRKYWFVWYVFWGNFPLKKREVSSDRQNHSEIVGWKTFSFKEQKWNCPQHFELNPGPPRRKTWKKRWQCVQFYNTLLSFLFATPFSFINFFKKKSFDKQENVIFLSFVLHSVSRVCLYSI